MIVIGIKYLILIKNLTKNKYLFKLVLLISLKMKDVLSFQVVQQMDLLVMNIYFIVNL